MKNKIFSFRLLLFIIICNIVTCSLVFADNVKTRCPMTFEEMWNGAQGNTGYYWSNESGQWIIKKVTWKQMSEEKALEQGYTPKGGWGYIEEDYDPGEIAEIAGRVYIFDGGVLDTSYPDGGQGYSTLKQAQEAKNAQDNGLLDNSDEYTDDSETDSKIDSEGDTTRYSNPGNSSSSDHSSNHNSDDEYDDEIDYDEDTPMVNSIWNGGGPTIEGGIKPVVALNQLDYLSDEHVEFPLHGIYVKIDPTETRFGGNIYLSTANTDMFKDLLKTLKYKPEGIEQISNFIEELKKLAALVNVSFAGATKFYQTKELTEARVQRKRMYEDEKLSQYFIVFIRFLGIALLLLAFIELVLGIVEATGYAGNFVLSILGGDTSSAANDTTVLFGFRLALLKHVISLVILGLIMLNLPWFLGIVSLFLKFLKGVLETFNINTDIINKLREAT